MAKREFLHNRTNKRTAKPLTAVKIAKVPDEASERASNHSLDIVRHFVFVCVGKQNFDDIKTETFMTLTISEYGNVALKF